MNKEEYYKCLREYEEEHVCNTKLLREYIEFLCKCRISLTRAEKYYDKFFKVYGELSCNTRRIYRSQLNRFTRFLYSKDMSIRPPRKLVHITGEDVHTILRGGLVLL